MTSYEACCILNASESATHVNLTIFFENRGPVGPYRFEKISFSVPALRLNKKEANRRGPFS